jgi:tetratricopeptide (TPR) repeat protein
MKPKNIAIVLFTLHGIVACLPAPSIPGVLEPLDSKKWKRCADELSKRESGAMLDDLTLDSSTLLCQGVVSAAEGKTDKALELFTEASVADKEDHRPHYLAGRVLAEAGRYEEAITAFERSYKRYPSMAVPSERLGRTIAKKSSPEEATRFLRRANMRGLCPYGCKGLLAQYLHELDKDSEAEEIYNEMVTSDPGEPAGWVGLASIQNAKGDFKGEKGYLEKALASEHFKDIGKLQKADIYYSLGFAKYNLQDYAGARSALDEALGLNAKRADWYVLAGWIALKEDNAAKALSSFDTARDLDPHLPAIHAGIGDAQLALGNVPGARVAYNLAHELDPTNGVFTLKTAHAAALAQDFEIAKKLLEEAKNLSGAGLPKDLVQKVTSLLAKKKASSSSGTTP